MHRSLSLLLYAACSSLALGQAASAADALDQKAVLVTGASSGIGLRIAETLSSNGFHVYAGARSPEDLERLDAMENVSAVRLDVTIQGDIDAAVAFVEREGRGLWGIVNNAGVVRYSPLSTGELAEAQFTFDVNFFGPLRINQAFLPFVIDSGGRTAIVGSINGVVAAANDGGYSASKFAVEGYTDSLALELSEVGVHVAIVEPGTYKTEIREKMLAQALASSARDGFTLDDATLAELELIASSNETMKEPDEVARAVLHLMSAESPKRRYLVAPNAEQAEFAIRAALRRALQLSDNLLYDFDRERLAAMLDELLVQRNSE